MIKLKLPKVPSMTKAPKNKTLVSILSNTGTATQFNNIMSTRVSPDSASTIKVSGATYTVLRSNKSTVKDGS